MPYKDRRQHLPAPGIPQLLRQVDPVAHDGADDGRAVVSGVCLDLLNGGIVPRKRDENQL